MNNSDGLIIGVDIGTSAGKVLCVDRKGQTVKARKTYGKRANVKHSACLATGKGTPHCPGKPGSPLLQQNYQVNDNAKDMSMRIITSDDSIETEMKNSRMIPGSKNAVFSILRHREN